MIDLAKPHYEFSVGPVEHSKVVVPIGGKRPTRDEAISAAAAYAKNMAYAHVRIEIVEV